MTEMAREWLSKQAPGLQQTIQDRTMMARDGTPEDVAHGAAFLAAPESGWITGASAAGGRWPNGFLGHPDITALTSAKLSWRHAARTRAGCCVTVWFSGATRGRERSPEDSDDAHLLCGMEFSRALLNLCKNADALPWRHPIRGHFISALISLLTVWLMRWCFRLSASSACPSTRQERSYPFRRSA